MSAAKHTPMAEVAENFVFFLRKQEDGNRWPVGTKLYAESPLIDAAPELLNALEALVSAGASADLSNWFKGMKQARAAIAKATGSAA